MPELTTSEPTARDAPPEVRRPFPAMVSEPVIHIRPSTSWAPLRLRELWEYRELLYFLTWRDVKVRYKQTALGAAWAVIQPLLTMVVFSVVFGRLAGLPSEGVPYPLFVYCALVPWTYFSNALAHASSSLVDHGRLITKVYFPRLLLPAAPVTGGLLDVAVNFLVLLGLLAYYGIAPTTALVTLPLFVLLAAAAALGASLWLSALNAEYRDIRYIVPFLLQFWLFATPVAYSSALVPERWRPLYGINPMTGVVDGFRWALLGTTPAPGGTLAVSVVATSLLPLGGLFWFRRMERHFADVV
jgi:lipopolysaccharide transport system permease protein